MYWARIGSLVFTLLGMSLLFSGGGCGNEHSSPGDTKDTSTTGVISDGPGEVNEAEPKKVDKTNTADRALLKVVDGFRENRPEAIWDFLPPSYRKEINLLAREFGRRMDAELWSATAEVAGKLARLLSDRKREILSHPAIQESELARTADLDAKWDGLVALLQTVTGSELADTRELRNFDGRTFLARFDQRALSQLSELSVLLHEDNPFSMLPQMIEGADVRLVDESGGVATVRITPHEGEPREYEFVLLEGQWFPKGWAEHLKTDLAAARSKLDVELAREAIARKKQVVLPYLQEMRAVLDRLAGAERDEFHRLMTEQVVKPFLQMREVALGSASAKASGGPVQTGGKSATVVVVGRLSPPEIERIAEAVLLTKDAVDRDLTINRQPDATAFILTPVRDLEAFAELIEFGRVTEIDAQARQIIVELNRPEAP